MRSIIIDTPYHVLTLMNYFEKTAIKPLSSEDKSDMVDIIFRVINGIAFNHTNNVVQDILNEILNLDNFLGYDLDIHGSVLVIYIDDTVTELFTMLNEMNLIGKTVNVIDYNNTNIRLNIY